MFITMLFSAVLLAQAPAASSPDWRAELDAGKKAYSKQQYAEAVTRLRAASESAPAAGMVECLRALSAVYRETGEHAEAETALRRALVESGGIDANSLEHATILEELAAVQRAQAHSEQALLSMDRAIQIREAHPDWPKVDLARDLTSAALLRQRTGDTDKAIELLQRAIAEWDAAAPGDVRSLLAIEALATAFRDRSMYAEAEPLFLRALRLREGATGPESADIISTVDSLAYVEFGLKKFAEAEVFYKRLLDLWERNAGPEHPMAALTLDKMAEFYAFQQRYSEAEAAATKALALRTQMHVGSLNQTGRILLMQARFGEAEELYARTVKIGDLARATDEWLDPVLRIHSKLLRAMQRTEEADALDARVSAALLRKADREGRRPSPVKMPGEQ